MLMSVRLVLVSKMYQWCVMRLSNIAFFLYFQIRASSRYIEEIHVRVTIVLFSQSQYTDLRSTIFSPTSSSVLCNKSSRIDSLSDERTIEVYMDIN